MKALKYILQIVLLSLIVSSCSKDYEEPPLNEPKYTGAPANMTIAQLKTLYKDITDVTVIDTDYIIKGYVTGNDISGNIYKQIFIQDNTGAICIGVDQSSINSLYRVGQEVYIQLHELAILKYGGELQIGFAGASANRIPWNDFQVKAIKNGWPDKANATPAVSDISNLTDDMLNKLVTFEEVYFAKGGNGLFTDDSGNQILKSLNGTGSVTVRSSSYSAQFAKLELPKGTGSITGILGRYNGTWQLTLRDTNDIGTFDGKEPTPTPEPSGVAFNETFGEGANREKVAAWTGWAEKAPVAYADASGNADVRQLSGNSHLWMPGAKDSYLTITGINTTGKSDLVLTYDVAANVYNEGETTDLALIQVKINGTAVNIPSKTVVAKADNNKFYTIEAGSFPAASNVTLEFYIPAASNVFGFRLDNIKIAPKDETIVVTP